MTRALLHVTSDCPIRAARAIEDAGLARALEASVAALRGALLRLDPDRYQQLLRAGDAPPPGNLADRPACVWASSCGAAWRWTVDYVAQLTVQHELIAGRPHVLTPAVHVLLNERNLHLADGGALSVDPQILYGQREALRMRWTKPGLPPTWANRQPPAWATDLRLFCVQHEPQSSLVERPLMRGRRDAYYWDPSDDPGTEMANVMFSSRREAQGFVRERVKVPARVLEYDYHSAVEDEWAIDHEEGDRE